MFEIRKGVPVPAINRHERKRESKYPFAEMEVGDSFVAANGTVTRAAVAHAMSHATKKLNWRFKSRRVEGGVGVWRVE